jgi:dolichol-phosphate mannosyltransferase
VNEGGQPLPGGHASPATDAGPPAVSVVVPTLNEAPNVDALISAVDAALAPVCGYEILVVDDASTDDTQARVRAWAGRAPVRLIARHGRPDLAQAVRDGAQAARAPLVVVMDADGSHPATALPALIAPLRDGTCDLMVGSRYVRGGAMPGWPLARRLLSRGATWLAWPYTDVRDPMAGFFAARRELLTGAPAQAAGYKILLELLATRPDLRVGEVPITFRDRTAGASKLGLRTQLLYLQRLMALAGGRVSGSGALRYGTVGLLGIALDVLVFRALLGAGATLALAHTAGFVVAASSNFVLNRQWTFAGTGTDRPAERYLHFLTLAVLALLLRGGVLAVTVDRLGLPPTLAIVPAVAAAALVNYLGAAFFVFHGPAASPEMRARVVMLGLAAYLVALRVAYVVPVDLILDETYYWNYAQHMALSFLDHPPLTAWLIGAGTALLGDGALGVRVGALACSVVTLVYAYRYGAAVGGKTLGLAGALLAVALPALFAAGMLMTPDAPLVAAGTAATYYLHRALVGGRADAWWKAGVAGGVALLAKYTAVLLAPAALVVALADPAARRWLRRPQPYVAIAIATALFTPVLVWNAQHGWASFAFQGTRRLSQDFEFSTHLFALHLLTLLGPFGLLGVVWGLTRGAARLAPTDRRFVRVFTAVPVTVFGAFSLFNYPHFHWTALAWVAALPALARSLRVGTGAPQWLAHLWRVGLPTTALVFGLVLHYLALGLPGLPRRDFGVGYLGWHAAAREVQAIEQEVERATRQRPIVVGLSKWSLASALRYHDADGRRANITSRQLLGDTGAMYEWWFRDESGGARPVIVVDFEPDELDAPEVRDSLRAPGPIRTRPVYERGTRVLTLYYRIAAGYDAGRVRGAVLRSVRSTPSSPP